MSDFLDYIQDTKTALVICSRPLDFDCIASGLLMKKYLDSLNKQTKIVFPSEMTQSEKDFNNFLPFFNEIDTYDTRELLKKEQFDLLVFVDGGNFPQFYDTATSDLNPPDFLSFPKRVHIDHHQTSDKIGTSTIHTTQTSSTTELVLTQVIPLDFLTEDLATLGYAGIVGDTANFKWNFYPSTLTLASKLLEKGARVLEIINKLYFSNTKRDLEILAYVISHTEYREDLASNFLFLPLEQIQKDNLNEADLEKIKFTFTSQVAKSVQGYDRGFIMYEKDKGIIKCSARGNNLTNKLDLPQLLKDANLKGGGHLQACAGKFEGDFNTAKDSLLSTLKSKLP